MDRFLNLDVLGIGIIRALTFKPRAKDESFGRISMKYFLTKE